jgi:para-aminobenzoate synthetase component 1
MSRQVLIDEVHAPTVPHAFELFQGRPYCFYLDSGMDHRRLGRYSFMGSDPFLVMSSRGRQVTLAGGGGMRVVEGDPFDVLKNLLATYAVERVESPIPFNGGVVGYLSYDLCHHMERLPARAVDDLRLPECYLCFYDRIVAFDHLEGRAYVASTGFPYVEGGRRMAWAQEKMAETKAMLEQGRDRVSPPVFGRESKKPGTGLRSNFSREEYVKVVERAREYISAGDIFQVNLSQRFEVELAIPPYELYRRLRLVSPAPFAGYLDFPGVSVASASPERFLRLRGDRVETRPIKGTRPRGENVAQDEAMARELVSSPKERAENVMIVDLERNDLGRVCCYGSVVVEELAALERFPHVFHLTSTITGRLRPDRGLIDLLRASFPGGSITGAPKVRAMEVIDELEPTRRSVYTGSIGYLGFDGDADLSIVIRTFIVKGSRAYFQVGGGVVYDSVPEAEYMETMHKAKGLIEALDMAPRAVVKTA